MIYVLLADGFEESEAIVPIDIMKRAGLNVVTASIGGKSVRGAHNIVVETDISIDDINKTDMEMLMLPGGMGHELLDKDIRVHELIEYAVSHDLYLSAICAAPSILGKKDILKGKKAVCFPGYEKYLNGADIVNEKAVKDGKIITAKGAGAAFEFGFMLVEALKNKDIAENLKKVMQF